MDQLKATTSPHRNPPHTPADRLIILADQLQVLATQVREAADELRQEIINDRARDQSQG